MTSAPFKVEIDTHDDLVYTVRLFGELRRGKALDAVPWKQVISDAEKASKTKVVIFDLAELSFWDTEGTEAVVGTVAKINTQKSKRAGLVAPKDPHVLVLASQRPVAPINSALVPCKNSRAELLAFLES